MSDDLVPILEPLLKLMSKHDLLELEVAREGMKIRLKKKYEGIRREVFALPGQASVASASSAGTSVPTGPDRTGLIAINSPMVGTFYRQSSPESEAFVELGSEVGRDSVVCIIEAMKVFNEIKAECEGEIVEILVENGHPIEYGQPLFFVRPKA